MSRTPTPPTPPTPPTRWAATALASAVLLVGCSDEPAPARVRTVVVTAVEGGCQVTASELPAGRTTFTVRNDRATAVDVRVIRGNDDLGAARAVAPGATATFDAVLLAGELGVACGRERSPLTVYGAVPSPA